VCLKERNMLLTQIGWAQAEQRRTQQPNRLLDGYISRIQHVSVGRQPPDDWRPAKRQGGWVETGGGVEKV
jgi:hypothetical protein